MATRAERLDEVLEHIEKEVTAIARRPRGGPPLRTQAQASALEPSIRGMHWTPAAPQPSEQVEATDLERLGSILGHAWYAWPARQCELRTTHRLWRLDDSTGGAVIHSSVFTPATAERPMEGTARPGRTVHTPAHDEDIWVAAKIVPTGSFAEAQAKQEAQAREVGELKSTRDAERKINLLRLQRHGAWLAGKISAAERDAD
jgi:hypothetical protein